MRPTAVRIGLAVIVGIAAALGGLFAAGVIGVPDAGLEDNAWGEVSDEEIEVLTTVWIDNPNPGFSLGDTRIDYAIAMNDVDLASGSADDVTVPSGNTTTELRTDLRYQRLPAWWASHIRNDEVSELAVETTAHVDVGPLSGSPSGTYTDEKATELEPMIAASLAEFEGEHTLSPVGSGAGTGTVEPTVEIRDTDAEWGAVTENRTELHLTFDVHNPNAHPLPTPALTGEMVFNEVTVAHWDAHEVDVRDGPDDATIPPQSSREITFVAELDNDDVAAWFATHADNEEVTDAEMRAQLAMQINGETRTIPDDEDAIHCTYELRTDIFVDQAAGLEREDCTLAPWAAPDDAAFEDRDSTDDRAGAETESESTESSDGLATVASRAS
ncbi:LEA type 2 family protein [Natrinema salifodinae]|uniref:LEA14-like dessication related protein n=1 Tax=Natrinema salifodinae TaxID=1202768 RepID=A0A1I0QFA6_9EURY|nr:LEA type 2 family protein [Natrinema salifodinae]SEW25701.1 LEA14-like dessication related protein [Natrinema salifodinae]